MGPPWGPQDLGHNICFQFIQKFSKSELCLLMTNDFFTAIFSAHHDPTDLSFLAFTWGATSPGGSTGPHMNGI